MLSTLILSNFLTLAMWTDIKCHLFLFVCVSLNNRLEMFSYFYGIRIFSLVIFVYLLCHFSVILFKLICVYDTNALLILYVAKIFSLLKNSLLIAFPWVPMKSSPSLCSVWPFFRNMFWPFLEREVPVAFIKECYVCFKNTNEVLYQLALEI